MGQINSEKPVAPWTTQREGFEKHFDDDHYRAAFEGRDYRRAGAIMRYFLERRLRIAIGRLMELTASKPEQWSVLVVCAGNGMEGTFLADQGFREVTISDFSESGLKWGTSLDSRLKGVLLDAGNMNLADNSYDLVLVQDGLHHLPQPTVGLTEMVRVAKRGVIVIEPHAGVVSNLFGLTWERTGSAVNYVFRWNKWLFCSVVQSYLLLGSRTPEIVARTPVDPRRPHRLNYNRKKGLPYRLEVIRLWDHQGVMLRLANLLGNGRLALTGVRAAYAGCACLLPRLGNMFLGILIKEDN